MSKGYGYRKLVHYGPKDAPSVEVKLAVYGHGTLTDSEIQKALDDVTERIVLALRDVPILQVRIHKVRSNRVGEF
jgi:hypothetical protein